jgi:hypothetical protein
MIGDSFTTENLLDILKAMQNIKPIDQSKCYEDYLEEIMNRLRYAKDRQDWIENQLQIAIKNQNLQNDKDSEH